MITVTVKLYANLVSMALPAVVARPGALRAGSPLQVEVPDGSTVADLADRLLANRNKVRVAFVNGRICPFDTLLAAQDEVGLFPAVGGG